MQQQLFEISQGEKRETVDSSIPTLSTNPEQHTKIGLLNDILSEEYLWDMRCWDKPKWQYTRDEVVSHVQQWLQDMQEDRWTFNCGCCLNCIKILLEKKWATIEEIADIVLRNPRIKYAHEIGTWGGEIVDPREEALV